IFIPTLNNLYAFHKSNEKLFTNVQAVNKIALIKGSRDEYRGLIKLLTEEHLMYDIIEPAAIGTGRTPRKLDDYEALILGDVSNMDEKFISIIDAYVMNGGKILTTGFTSTKDAQGKPINRLRLNSLGVESSYDFYSRAKSTYLKVSNEDQMALGLDEFKDFSIMMMYSDFMKCNLTGKATGYM